MTLGTHPLAKLRVDHVGSLLRPDSLKQMFMDYGENRIDVEAQVTKVYECFGRPQGMAFDDEGALYVTEGLIGGSGVYRLEQDGRPERVVASPPLVGLAFDGNGGLVLASSSTVYRLAL